MGSIIIGAILIALVYAFFFIAMLFGMPTSIKKFSTDGYKPDDASPNIMVLRFIDSWPLWLKNTIIVLMIVAWPLYFALVIVIGVVYIIIRVLPKLIASSILELKDHMRG